MQQLDVINLNIISIINLIPDGYKVPVYVDKNQNIIVNGVDGNKDTILQICNIANVFWWTCDFMCPHACKSKVLGIMRKCHAQIIAHNDSTMQRNPTL